LPRRTIDWPSANERM